MDDQIEDIFNYPQPQVRRREPFHAVVEWADPPSDEWFGTQTQLPFDDFSQPTYSSSSQQYHSLPLSQQGPHSHNDGSARRTRRRVGSLGSPFQQRTPRRNQDNTGTSWFDFAHEDGPEGTASPALPHVCECVQLRLEVNDLRNELAAQTERYVPPNGCNA
jgi:hypothetical protein